MSTLPTSLIETNEILSKSFKEKYISKFGKCLSYGSSGFRTDSEYMPYLAFRSAIFISYFSKTKIGNVFGIMITASHNQISDNGIKLVNFGGGYFTKDIELIIEAFTSEFNIELAIQNLKARFQLCYISLVNNFGEINFELSGEIFIGMDTRPSSKNLHFIITDAISETFSRPKSFGVITTPQLHFFVWWKNVGSKSDVYSEVLDSLPKALIYQAYDHFNENVFKELMRLISFDGKTELIIDFGNGVGGCSLPIFFSDIFNLKFINQFNMNELNFECGAEFVQKDFKFPKNFPFTEGILCSSFDGDADRIIYSFSEKEKFCLLDGGKICALYALTIRRLLDLIENDENLKNFSKKFTIGIIQTAYSNGSTLSYFKSDLNLPLAIVPTGFKYLEFEAEKYDLGIAFEPNGHGTIFLKEGFLNALETELRAATNVNSKKNLEIFKNFLFLSNQATGDAIMNTLCIEFCLRFLKISPIQWSELYSDLPNKTVKIYVNDKNAIKTTWDEQQITNPLSLQKDIDKIISKYELSRSFVRPSGTENILRLYIESKNEEDIIKIEEEIREIITEMKI